MRSCLFRAIFLLLLFHSFADISWLSLSNCFPSVSCVYSLLYLLLILSSSILSLICFSCVSSAYISYLSFNNLDINEHKLLHKLMSCWFKEIARGHRSTEGAKAEQLKFRYLNVPPSNPWFIIFLTATFPLYLKMQFSG